MKDSQKEYRFVLSEGVIFFSNYPLPKTRQIQLKIKDTNELVELRLNGKLDKISLQEHVGSFFYNSGRTW